MVLYRSQHGLRTMRRDCIVWSTPNGPGPPLEPDYTTTATPQLVRTKSADLFIWAWSGLLGEKIREGPIRLGQSRTRRPVRDLSKGAEGGNKSQRTQRKITQTLSVSSSERKREREQVWGGMTRSNLCRFAGESFPPRRRRTERRGQCPIG